MLVLSKKLADPFLEDFSSLYGIKPFIAIISGHEIGGKLAICLELRRMSHYFWG